MEIRDYSDSVSNRGGIRTRFLIVSHPMRLADWVSWEIWCLLELFLCHLYVSGTDLGFPKGGKIYQNIKILRILFYMGPPLKNVVSFVAAG